MPQKKRDVAVADRFGQNLRRERRRAGFSQEQLATLAGLHRTEVGKLENGERVPRIDTLVRLADSAGTTTAALLDGIHWVPAPEVAGAFSFPSGADSWRREGSLTKRNE